MERYRVKVHKKGFIIIPAEVRRKLGLHEGSYLELVVENESVRLIVPRSLKDFFGADGEKAVEVAKLILSSKRDEIAREIHSRR